MVSKTGTRHLLAAARELTKQDKKNNKEPEFVSW
jgi:hypothetical protein